MFKSNEIKVYIAAPFFSPVQAATVLALENLLVRGDGIAYYSPRDEGMLKDMTETERKERMTYIFERNKEMINWCTHVLAVIDDYDTGTVWEMGYACALGKKIVTFTDHYYDINVMLNESIVAHCKHFVEIVPSLLGENVTEKGSDVI